MPWLTNILEKCPELNSNLLNPYPVCVLLGMNSRVDPGMTSALHYMVAVVLFLDRPAKQEGLTQ